MSGPLIPKFERCRKLPPRSKYHALGEHVVMATDVSYDGHTWSGWCKFCGEMVYAEDKADHWRPYRPYIISEEPDFRDFVAN